jgi:hypothetical protein
MSTQLKTNPKVLQCLLALKLDIHIWSARRKLTPEDFSHAKLPPEQVASLGSKKICDPEELRVFGTLKSRAVSVLNRHGVKFIGGWAIPEGRADSIIQELESIEADFLKAKKDFIANYDKSIKKWIKDNPGWENIIAGSTVSAEYVANRLSFQWQVFKVQNPDPRSDSKLSRGLNKQVEGLADALFCDLAKSADEAWKKSYLNKTELTRRALSPLRNMLQKLDDMSFVEPRVTPVSSLIRVALDKLPKRGAIIGPDLLMLKGLVSLLTDTKNLLRYSNDIINGKSENSILDAFASPLRKRAKAKQAPVNKLQSLGLW